MPKMTKIGGKVKKALRSMGRDFKHSKLVKASCTPVRLKKGGLF